MKYTKEQVIEKFGEIELSFSDYYKYSFNFTYKDTFLEIFGSFGGSSDDIYRYSLNADSKVKVKDFSDNLMSLTIKENGIIVFDYSDY